jgi:hypothetical protein
MLRTTIVVAAGLTLAALLPASPAQALRARVFVAKTGADVGNCSFSAPCQSLNFAYNAVLPGGEITIIDNAGYEPLTINKALTITGPTGLEAGIAVPSGGIGITVNAGPADAVSLNGLVINGAGIGAWGIVFNSGALLVIENCVARNLTSSGMALQPAAPARIAVSNTLVANNGVHGIYLQPHGTGTVSAVFKRVEAYSNGQEGIGIYGNDMAGELEASAVDSVAAFNNDGFYAYGSLGSGGSAGVTLSVSRSTTRGNVRNGIRAEQNAYIYVDGSSLDGDWWAQATSGCVRSYGDNEAQAVTAPCGIIGKQ